MPPKRNNKRKAEKGDTGRAQPQVKRQRNDHKKKVLQEDQPVEKKFKISPVDRWNAEPAPGEFVLQGLMKDGHGWMHKVIKILLVYDKIRWKGENRLGCEGLEEGELVSPKTVPEMPRWDI